MKRNPTEWICGGKIQDLASQAGFEPQNAGRRLRECENSKDLIVEYRIGKNGAKVAWYKLNSEKFKQHVYYIPELDKQVTLFK